ncbi:DNA helicase [Cyanophage S-RIM12_Sn_31_0910]|uniref:DNA helicase n=2 Tax=Brizovirus TaxID=2733098 RepID=A0A1D7SQ75_9CAUD|nr:DNA helicase [Cyanophage S-RIM12 isolate RW_01_0310]AOO15824.1 DNA helicase [Cyanophage S-RIM12 isolate RW_01_0310]AOO18401.1 DNA helicase [Cyanophage S-RIM12_Sn_31_0910]
MDLRIRKKNEVYLKIEAEPHINYELADYFCFEVESAKYMQKQRRWKGWDGKIRLYSPATGEIYCGLLDYLLEWADEKKYQYKFEECKFFGHPLAQNEFITPEGVVGFVKSLRLPYPVRDYQYKAIYEALKYNRRLLLSPTASGKSLMIYALVRFHVNANRNILIVVPTTSLVEQMYKDFEEYGWVCAENCHKIYAGQEKYTNHQVVITTWQSIYKEPRKWFDRFDVVIGDEAHLFKAKSLTSLMGKLHECKYRIGFTGTLDGANVNQLVLEGVFGRCSQVTRTAQLMQEGHVAKLKVKIVLVKHEEKLFEGYQDEIGYLVEHESRNKFIRNLACDLKGNTLVLFNYVERHGVPLYEMINSYTERPVHFVHGGVDVSDREDIRLLTEKSDNAIIVASYGTFSTGINIKNLHNVIFASPSKSRVRNLQSIGRVLRKGENKSQATLYDIADDISTDRGNNYTLNHLMERVKVYNQEKFNYEIIDVNLKTYD